MCVPQCVILRSRPIDDTSRLKTKLVGHVNEYPTMHYFGTPELTQSMIRTIVFLEIPVKNYIAGMLLTFNLDNSTNILSKLTWSIQVLLHEFYYSWPSFNTNPAMEILERLGIPFTIGFSSDV